MAREFGVRLLKQAEKSYAKLDVATRNRVLERLGEIAQDPFDTRMSKKLEMGKGERITRVGDWRIIYAVDEPGKIVHIFSIEPRSKAYRKF
jgi:mRNA interferase RelE/StbE